MISFHLNVSIILFFFFLQKYGILGYVFLKMSLHNIIFISGRLTYFLVAEYRIYQWQIIIFNGRISYLLVAEYRIYQWQNIVFISGRLILILLRINIITCLRNRICESSCRFAEVFQEYSRKEARKTKNHQLLLVNKNRSLKIIEKVWKTLLMVVSCW